MSNKAAITNIVLINDHNTALVKRGALHVDTAAIAKNNAMNTKSIVSD